MNPKLTLNELFTVKLDLYYKENETTEKLSVSNIYFGYAFRELYEDYSMGISDLNQISNLTQTRHLVLLSSYNNKFTGSFDDLSPLADLETIYIRGCYEISGDMSQFSNLKQLYLQGYSNIPESIYSIPNLQTLSLSDPYSEYFDYVNFENMAQLSSLKKVLLKNITAATGSIDELQGISLEDLSIVCCSCIEADISFLSGFPDLKTLSLYSCDGITGDISSLMDLLKLESLTINNMTNLTGDISSFSSFKNLKSLELYRLQFTGEISSLSPLTSLKWLTLSDIDGIMGDVGALENLDQLLVMYINSCSGLTGDLSKLTLDQLAVASVKNCDGLTGEIIVSNQ